MVSDEAAALLETQLLQSGNIAQNNFITVQKVVDYDHLEYKRVLSFAQALGVREVQTNPNQ